MRFSTRLLTAALLTALAGCSSFSNSKANPKNWFSSNDGKNTRPVDGGGRMPATDFSATAADRAPRGEGSGLLAGRVLDSFNQTRPGAEIQVVPAEARQGDSPVEVTTDSQGYFVIQNLEAGRRYRLSARQQRDNHLLAGTTLATPPNAVVIIKLSEDFAGPDTPPPSPRRSGRSAPDSEGGWSPEAAPKYLHEPDKGGREAVPPPRPEYQTGTGQNIPPRATIPGPGTRGPLPEVGAPATRPEAPGSVSSCTVNGARLEDFCLLDLTEQPFRLSEHRSKLTLLDFWGTWCTPCIQGMPYLVDLQRRHAPHGLEVIGIAYEDNSLPLSHKIEQVNFVRRRQSVNYKILLGDGESCPVLNKLDVRSFPTLLLIDEGGEILWRGEGLSPQNKARLELEIERRLQRR